MLHFCWSKGNPIILHKNVKTFPHQGWPWHEGSTRRTKSNAAYHKSRLCQWLCWDIGRAGKIHRARWRSAVKQCLGARREKARAEVSCGAQISKFMSGQNLYSKDTASYQHDVHSSRYLSELAFSSLHSSRWKRCFGPIRSRLSYNETRAEFLPISISFALDQWKNSGLTE